MFVRYQKSLASRVSRYIDPHRQNKSQNNPEPTPVEPPTHGTYGALLFDPRWRQKRQEILKRDGHACYICNTQEELQVHHRQYHWLSNDQAFKMPWEYEDHLLLTLCNNCHKRGHNQYKVPIINL